MTRIDFKELLKAVKLLEKDSLGGPVTFKEDGCVLKISCTDKSGREIIIELSDLQYPFQPRVVKVETF